MSSISIRAVGLGKRYRIGKKHAGYRTLREAVVDTLAGPFQRAGRILRGQPASGHQAREFWALRDTSFEVQEGEAIGLIGRNGAGKSTLLKVLSRISEPNAGYAELRGRVGSLLEVGTGFHPELTGRDNIYLSAAILGMKRTEIMKEFDAIVSFADVEDFLETPVKHYSSGMYLRLAFAVAAHLNPEIMLVDEVLAVGDVEFQKKCLGKMEDVAGAGRTVVFVSHNLPAIQRLCTRAIYLADGTVKQIGGVNEVVNAYLNSKTGQPGERVWPSRAEAPGDDVVRLESVRAVGADGAIANSIKVTDAVSIEVAFWVLQPGHELDAAIYLHDQSGNLISVVGDWSEDEWKGRERPVGLHRSRCHIPANFLNEGQITVQVAVATHPYTLHAIERNAILLQILDDMTGGGARGHYPREWPGGAVRPKFPWTFEHDPSVQ